jgi:hypothetical protein
MVRKLFAPDFRHFGLRLIALEGRGLPNRHDVPGHGINFGQQVMTNHKPRLPFLLVTGVVGPLGLFSALSGRHTVGGVVILGVLHTQSLPSSISLCWAQTGIWHVAHWPIAKVPHEQLDTPDGSTCLKTASQCPHR